MTPEDLRNLLSIIPEEGPSFPALVGDQIKKGAHAGKYPCTTLEGIVYVDPGCLHMLRKEHHEQARKILQAFPTIE